MVQRKCKLKHREIFWGTPEVEKQHLMVYINKEREEPLSPSLSFLK